MHTTKSDIFKRWEGNYERIVLKTGYFTYLKGKLTLMILIFKLTLLSRLYKERDYQYLDCVNWGLK